MHRAHLNGFLQIMKSATSRYMPHIDGLRCVAVLAVLLFHFGVPGLGGGYVGVDIFFVISGYLITSIIRSELVETGGFRFGNFYARRVRRILPALIVTLLTTTVLAVLSLTPADLVAYGKSLLASALSVSNLLFWSESGYFDAASQTKPLLHTWSLSVEEQFYLLWPAFLFLCHRFGGRRGIAWGIVVAGAASFLANHLAVAGQSVGFASDLFFLPQFRVFEFAIGAAGCFIAARLPASRWLHEGMFAVGVALIVYSIITLVEGDVFPYTNAIAPCLGTLLVIASSRSHATALLLANPLAVWFGKISYSLYLTHWPVVVFVTQFMPHSPWAVQFSLMVVLSLLTAVALHHWVEVRFRYVDPAAPKGALVGRTLGVSLFCCALGVAVLASNGMVWRYQYFTPGMVGPGTTASASAQGPAARAEVPVFQPLAAADIEAGKGRRFEALAAACNVQSLQDSSRCPMDRPVQVLLFGNSHEPDGFNAFAQIYGHDHRVNLINFGTVNDCKVVLERGRIASPTPELACDTRFAALDDDRLVQALDVVVYNTHQGFDPIAADLWRILEILKTRNPQLKIIAIGSFLQTTSDCASLYNRYGSFDACKRPDLVNYFNPDERAKSTIPQVKSLPYLYISKYELLCGGNAMEGCVMEANGEPAFYDQHHLSLGYARFMGQQLAKRHAADLVAAGLPEPVSSKE